jgi:hypothetical protein
VIFKFNNVPPNWYFDCERSTTLIRVLITLAVFLFIGRVSATQIGLFNPTTLKPSDIGDLFVVQNGKPTKQLTAWGYNHTPIISWNKRFAAYQSETQTYVDEHKRSGEFAGNPTLNTYLIDLNSLKIRKLTQGQTWARSTVVWSPDSKFFVWTEYDTQKIQVSLRLMMASLEQPKPRTILNDVPSVGGAGSDYFPQLDWLRAGLVIIGNPEDDNDQDCVLLSPNQKWAVRRTKSPYTVSCYFALGL